MNKTISEGDFEELKDAVDALDGERADIYLGPICSLIKSARTAVFGATDAEDVTPVHPEELHHEWIDYRLEMVGSFDELLSDGTFQVRDLFRTKEGRLWELVEPASLADIGFMHGLMRSGAALYRLKPTPPEPIQTLCKYRSDGYLEVDMGLRLIPGEYYDVTLTKRARP